MEALMMSVIGVFALGVVGWELWSARARAQDRIPADWQLMLARIANEQELGHHRHARQAILQACRRIHTDQDGVRIAGTCMGASPVCCRGTRCMARWCGRSARPASMSRR